MSNMTILFLSERFKKKKIAGVMLQKIIILIKFQLSVLVH